MCACWGGGYFCIYFSTFVTVFSSGVPGRLPPQALNDIACVEIPKREKQKKGESGEGNDVINLIRVNKKNARDGEKTRDNYGLMSRNKWKHSSGEIIKKELNKQKMGPLTSNALWPRRHPLMAGTRSQLLPCSRSSCLSAVIR